MRWTHALTAANTQIGMNSVAIEHVFFRYHIGKATTLGVHRGLPKILRPKQRAVLRFVTSHKHLSHAVRLSSFEAWKQADNQREEHNLHKFLQLISLSTLMCEYKKTFTIQF